MFPCAFNIGMFGKPLPYDAEVEYLSSNGSQWIDTGMLGNENTNIEIDAVLFGTTQDSNAPVCDVIGDLTISPSRALSLRIPIGSAVRYISRFGSLYYTTTGNERHPSKGVRAFVELKSRVLSYDGITMWSYGIPPSFTTAANLRIFSISTHNGILDLYSAKILYGENMMRNFIPVRFTNEDGETEGAMYDRVSGQLFRNQGTGAFVIGPDKT